MIPSPFHLWDSFTANDLPLFFGRDKEIDFVATKIKENRLFLLYGPAATAKSSIIHCGLHYQFAKNDWLPIYVRRGSDYNINEKLFAEINKVAITKLSIDKLLHNNVNYNVLDTTQQSKELEILINSIQSVYNDHQKPLYFFFDQLEELFIFGSDNEKHEFAKNINKISQANFPVNVILVLREEFLAKIHDLEHAVPHIMHNRHRISPVNREEAIRIVSQYCAALKIKTDDNFSSAIVAKCCDNKEIVNLATLQALLYKTYAAALVIAASGKSISGDGIHQNIVLSSTIVGEIGISHDWIAQHIEELVNTCNHKEEAWYVLKAYASSEATRKQAAIEEVIDFTQTLGKNIDRETIYQCLQQFKNNKLLTEPDENQKYELRHDVLAEKIHERITKLETELIKVFEFVENAYIAYETSHVWLTEQELNYIAPYENRLFLPAHFRSFIHQSRYELHKAKHRKRRFAFLSIGILLFIFVAFSAWALWERNNAIKQKEIALQQKAIAIEQEQLAQKLKIEAEIKRNEAINAQNIAIQEKAKAEQAKKFAEQQQSIAFNNAQLAEQQRIIAVQAMDEANRQKGIAQQHEQTALTEKQNAIENLKIANQRLFELFSEKAKNAALEKNYNAANLYAAHALAMDNSKSFTVFPDFPLEKEIMLSGDFKKIYSNNDTDLFIVQIKNNNLSIYGFEKGQELFTFYDKAGIKDVCCSDKLKTIAICNKNDSLMIWDVNSHKLYLDINIANRKQKEFNNIAQLIGMPTKNAVIYFNNKGSIIRVEQQEIKNNILINNEILFESGVLIFKVLREKNYLYAFDDFAIAKFSDKKLFVLGEHYDTVTDLMQVGNVVFSIAKDKTLKRWAKTSNYYEETDSVKFNCEPLALYQPKKNKSFIAVVLQNGIVECFQTDNLKKILQLQVGKAKSIKEIAFINNDKKMVVFLTNNKAMVWDISNLYQNKDFIVSGFKVNKDKISSQSQLYQRYNLKLENLNLETIK